MCTLPIGSQANSGVGICKDLTMHGTASKLHNELDGSALHRAKALDLGRPGKIQVSDTLGTRFEILLNP